MKTRLFLLPLLAVFITSCSGDTPDDCAFEAEDGSCAVTVSSSGALECKLDDPALCSTMTAYLGNGPGAIGEAQAALRKPGGSVSPAPALICEPPGTFMCTCCSVSAGCYRCP